MPTLVSIIISTRNRAVSLRQTLAAIAQLPLPSRLSAELLVVDNGSTDETPAVLREYRSASIPCIPLVHPTPGKASALNAAIAVSKGAILLFTDDDVRPPTRWLDGMSAPILQNTADVVVGGVVIPPHLHRPWMTPFHCALLADTQTINPQDPQYVVGANFACARRVLAAVPSFDPELGPGFLGAAEEHLFSLQLKQAGFRFASALDVQVEHHFDPARLTRPNFLVAAERIGRSNAYVAHHWEHRTLSFLTFHHVVRQFRLFLWRAFHPFARFDGVCQRELELLISATYFHKLSALRRAPRLYSHQGLVKLNLAN